VTSQFADEIAADLERAEQSIQAARQLASGGYYDFAASRAYYAAFYAATALTQFPRSITTISLFFG